MTPGLPASLQDTPELGRWISLDRQGLVVFQTGKVELGQGILTALGQIVAQEMATDVARVMPAPVGTDVSPNEGVTAGSLSVEVSGGALRLAAAQAHAALIAAAAARLGVSTGDISHHDGRSCTGAGPAA